jgi:hypothetical protein
MLFRFSMSGSTLILVAKCAFVEAREALRVRGGVTEARQGNQNY